MNGRSGRGFGGPDSAWAGSAMHRDHARARPRRRSCGLKRGSRSTRADVDAGRLEGQRLVVLDGDRALAMTQVRRNAALGAGERLGVAAADRGERLRNLQCRRRAAVDARRRDLGQAARRQVAGASAAEAAAGQPHAHLPLGHASAHAIAEAQRARLRVELECARPRARPARSPLIAARSSTRYQRLVAAAGLFDLHLQRRGIDGSLGQRERPDRPRRSIRPARGRRASSR